MGDWLYIYFFVALCATFYIAYWLGKREGRRSFPGLTYNDFTKMTKEVERLLDKAMGPDPFDDERPTDHGQVKVKPVDGPGPTVVRIDGEVIMNDDDTKAELVKHIGHHVSFSRDAMQTHSSFSCSDCEFGPMRISEALLLKEGKGMTEMFPFLARRRQPAFPDSEELGKGWGP